MAKTFRLPKEEPLLNIASYARGGPRPADRLTPSQIEQIRLTVNRAPEAVVNVLVVTAGSGGDLEMFVPLAHAPGHAQADFGEALVEIGGRPILWHLMRIYSHWGYRRFVLALGYKGDQIKDYFLN